MNGLFFATSIGETPFMDVLDFITSSIVYILILAWLLVHDWSGDSDKPFEPAASSRGTEDQL